MADYAYLLQFTGNTDNMYCTKIADCTCLPDIRGDINNIYWTKIADYTCLPKSVPLAYTQQR